MGIKQLIPLITGESRWFTWAPADPPSYYSPTTLHYWWNPATDVLWMAVGYKWERSQEDYSLHLQINKEWKAELITIREILGYA